MNTSKRLMLALFAAFAMSALFTVFLGRYLERVSASEHAKMRPYQSPKREIASGEVLHAEDLETIYWPTSKPVDGALTKEQDAVNRVALYPLAPGQPILDRDLAVAGSGTGLASKIPPGMRAIALKSDEVVGVAGFLNPGSFVDVLVTSKGTYGSDPVTATVLQNAEVVATGQQTEPNPSGKPTTTTVVTLLLDPQQAERALLASNQGSLQFALRNGADKNIAHSVPVTMSEIAPTVASKSTLAAVAALPGMSPQQVPMASHPAPAGGASAVHTARKQASDRVNASPQIEVVYGSAKSSNGLSMGGGSGSGGMPAGPSLAGLTGMSGAGASATDNAAAAAAPAMGGK